MYLTDPALEDRIRKLSQEMSPIPANVPAQLRSLDDIRAVLFDVYGTLFISGTGDISIAGEHHDSHALRSALQACGGAGNLEHAGQVGINAFEENIRKMHAQRRQQGIESPEVDILEVWRDVLEDLVGIGVIQVDITEQALRILAVEFECRVNPVFPMPGAAELINHFYSQNVPLGIVSNAQFYTPLLFPALIGAPLDQLGFNSELCSFSFNLLEAKPSPSMFKQPLAVLHREFGIEAGEVVYVGNDCLNDVYTASAAGCRTVLFAGDQRSLRMRSDEARCEGLKPDAVITSLTQLEEILL